MTSSTSHTGPGGSGPSRWTLLRDLVVFQAKLAIDGLRDFALLPVSFVAALVDLLAGGSRFYTVVHWGRRSERWIDLFAAADRFPKPEPTTVLEQQRLDDLVARVEELVVEQHRKGGLTAAAKRAIDQALDSIQRKGE